MNKTSKKKIFRRIIVIILALIFLMVAGGSFYFYQNKKEFVDQLTALYNDYYPGTLSYDDVEIKHWARFPNTALRFNNLSLVDTSSVKRVNFKAAEVDLYLSLKSILKKEIQIKSLRIHQGELSIDDHTPLSEDELKGTGRKSDSQIDTEALISKYFRKKTELDLEDLQLNITNRAKNKAFGIHINKFSSKSNFEAGEIRSESEMNVKIEELGFNLEKGTFGNNTQISGIFNSVLHLEKSELNIDTFDLHIDEQTFKTKASFLIKKNSKFSIVFENQETRFEPSIKLLSSNIRDKLSKISIQNPINVRVSLDGDFIYKGNPLVKVDFNTEDNFLTLLDTIPIDQLNMKGIFVNRFYDDERAQTEDLKDFRASLEEFTGNWRGLEFELNDFLYSSGPEAENQIHSALSADGSPTQFNDLLPDQNLGFNQGHFELFLEVDGELASPAELLERSTGTLRISNTTITNKLNEVSIPINALNASIDKNAAQLQKLEIPLNNRDLITLAGHLNNVSGLIRKEDRKSASSNFELSSENVIWKDFLALFKVAKKDRSSTAKKPELILQEALIALYEDYNPSLNVSIKNFHYRELDMHNFEADIYYDHKHLLRLDETRLQIDGGQMDISAALDLETPGMIGLQSQINGSGNISFLEDLFHSQVFSIQGGKFSIFADVSGDLLKLEGMVGQSAIKFEIEDTDFLYKPDGLRIPVQKIDFDLKNDDAVLNSMLVRIGNEEKIEITGALKKLSSLLFEPERGNVSSRLNMYSKRLEWDNFLILFQNDGQKLSAAEARHKSKRRLKETLREIYLSFKPEVTVDIDEFRYGDVMNFSNFHTNVHYEDQNTLIFKDTRVNFGSNGSVYLNAKMDISSELGTPVMAEIEARGDPDDLSLIFNESAFSMKGGSYDLKAVVNGDVMKIDELIANSDSHLIVENSALQHQPSGASIPCKILDVQLRENNAYLKEFTMVLASGHEMQFSGEKRYASVLFRQNLSDSSTIKSDLFVQSKELNFDDFINLFRLEALPEKANRSPIALKEALKDFYRRYQPSLKFDIKKFTYDQLTVNNLVSGFHFDNENQFYLESTAFDFYDGYVELDAHFDLTETHTTPFAFAFNTEALELDKVLESFEYFGIESLQNTEKIAGKITVHTELQGDLIDSTGIDIPTLKGKIEYDVTDMRLIGFEPLIQVANKVFKKERFQDIRFNSIKDTLYISESILEIPIVEIQSTAIQLFVLGHMGLEDIPTNIWTAIPLSNLKSRDLVSLPDKKGYIESGKNVYVEAKTAKDGTMKYVLHLNPKKYYQERGMISNYRQEIKEYRYQRRQYKRESRRTERQTKKADTSPDNF